MDWTKLTSRALARGPARRPPAPPCAPHPLRGHDTRARTPPSLAPAAGAAARHRPPRRGRGRGHTHRSGATRDNGARPPHTQIAAPIPPEEMRASQDHRDSSPSGAHRSSLATAPRAPAAGRTASGRGFSDGEHTAAGPEVRRPNSSRIRRRRSPGLWRRTRGLGVRICTSITGATDTSCCDCWPCHPHATSCAGGTAIRPHPNSAGPNRTEFPGDANFGCRASLFDPINNGRPVKQSVRPSFDTVDLPRPWVLQPSFPFPSTPPKPNQADRMLQARGASSLLAFSHRKSKAQPCRELCGGKRSRATRAAGGAWAPCARPRAS